MKHRRRHICALTLAAGPLWLGAAHSAQAECLSIADVIQAEEAARAYLAAPDAAATRNALAARLDLLAALHPGAESSGQTVMGRFIASRRMLPMVRDAAGGDALKAYAEEPAYAEPFAILTAPETPADCGSPKDEPPPARPAENRRRPAAGAPAARAPAPLAALPFDLDSFPAPDLRYLLGVALLLAAAWLAPLRRRRERRYVVFQPARLMTEDGEIEAHVLDISRSGARLRSEGRFSVGQILDLRIGRGAHWAEIRWIKGDMKGVLFRERLSRADFRDFIRRARRGAGAALSERPEARPAGGARQWRANGGAAG